MLPPTLYRIEYEQLMAATWSRGLRGSVQISFSSVPTNLKIFILKVRRDVKVKKANFFRIYIKLDISTKVKEVAIS